MLSPADYELDVENLARFRMVLWVQTNSYGTITSKIKHAIKLKTSPARHAQLLQPSLAFCFSLQPMMVHRPVRRHWLQTKTKC